MALVLFRSDRDRLQKLVGLLGSDIPTERAVAARKATELLERIGANWADLIASLAVQASPRYITLPETRLAAEKIRVLS